MIKLRFAPFRKLAHDRRGIAATEFALIAPALIFLVMGVFEMSYRFRASEEATRYVHQVADLIARESELDTASLEEIYNASIYLMKPLDTTDRLDLDISSISFATADLDPTMMWRRVAGTPVSFDIEDARVLGVEDESVIRVGVRYRYESILSDLFGGGSMTIEKTAYSRPRIDRLITLDGQTTDGGDTVYIGT